MKVYYIIIINKYWPIINGDGVTVGENGWVDEGFMYVCVYVMNVLNTLMSMNVIRPVNGI